MVLKLKISNSNLFVVFCLTLVSTILPKENKIPKDYILCRQCGFDVASADAVVNLRSPAAVSRTNESLFGVDKVDIQTLVNPLNINFRVFTVLEASCVTRGQDWVSKHSWYPGYAWKPCTCSRCRQHLDWAFEPLQLADSHKVHASDKGFYALVLDSVISELFQYSPTVSTIHGLFGYGPERLSDPPPMHAHTPPGCPCQPFSAACHK